jgi:aspartyl-tRNA(Asn)/glutamyl-tRNA(Gln) amidotransferase subunit C
MKITPRDVEHVAALARLKIEEDEIEIFTGQMNSILEYFETLQNADTDNVQPATHAVTLNNAFRNDKTVKSLELQKVLGNAPDAEKGCFKVPKIIEG